MALTFPGSVISLSFSGINDIKPSLKVYGREAFLNGTIMSIYFLEYSTGRSSRPGDFPTFIDKMVALTSSVTEQSKSST